MSTAPRPDGRDTVAGPPAPLRRTLALTRPERGRLVLTVALGAASMASAVGLLATSAWMISRASQQPSIAALGVAVAAVRFFAISRGLFRYAERLAGHGAAFRLLADLRVAVYRRLERLAPAGVPGFRRGDLLARMVDDVDRLQDLVLRVLPPVAVAAVVGTAAVVLVAWFLPSAAVVLALALAAAAVAVPALGARLAARREAGQAAARAALATSLVDLLEGAPDLVANGAMARQAAVVAGDDDRLTRIAGASAATTGVTGGLISLLTGLAVWGAAVLGVGAVASGRLDGVYLAVVVLVPLAVFEVVAGLPAATQALVHVRQAAARVFGVLDAPEPVPDPVAPVDVPAGPPTVRVRGLRARHHPGAPLALDGVDLDLAPGRRVAVVGPSGAGKTTLLGVLVRFVPYEAGTVSLGGTALDTLRGDDVRRTIGLVEQQPHLFDSTVRQNLLLARPGADDSELLDALRRVGLESWLTSLPAGLDTTVGERGARLSGGQRQRLAAARALLARFPVLLLDEPGEHLEPAAADRLTAELLAAVAPGSGPVCSGATAPALLLVTHRLLGLEAMDEIVVLDHGCVVERGAHDELVAAGGHYAAAWHRQVAATREVAARPAQAPGVGAGEDEA